MKNWSVNLQFQAYIYAIDIWQGWDSRSVEKVYTILSWNWSIPTFTFFIRFGWKKKNEASVLSFCTKEDRGTVVTHLLLLVYLLSYLFSVKKKPGMQVELCPPERDLWIDLFENRVIADKIKSELDILD